VARLLAASILVGSLTLAFAQSAQAQTDFYKGKTVTLVVGSRVTGSLSIGAQIVAAARSGENEPSSPRYFSSIVPPPE